MFNKTKLDSKVRFQKSSFKKKLGEARNYKRELAKPPEKLYEKTFAKLGLKSRTSKVLLFIILALLVYVVYVPNFLFIKNVYIDGLLPAQRDTAKQQVETFFAHHKSWPQQNFFLLSNKQLSNYLLTYDQDILSVDQITKSFPNSIRIKVTPRDDRYLIQTLSGLYSISNDGKARKQIADQDLNSTSSVNSGLIKINLPDPKTEIIIGQQPLSGNILNFIDNAFENLPNITKSQVTEFELKTQDDINLKIVLSAGYYILADDSEDPNQLWPKVSLLLAKLPSGDSQKIYYIDMSIPDRAFVCIKGTACTVDTRIIQSTSTLDSINP